MKHIVGRTTWLIVLFVSMGLMASSKVALAGENEVGVGLMFSTISEDGSDNGFGLGLSYAREILPGIAVEGEFDYKKFDFKGDTENGRIAGDITTFPIRIAGQYRFGSTGSVKPWLGAGLGYYFNKADLDTDPEKNVADLLNADCSASALDCSYSVPTELKDALGFHIGGGLDFPLKEVTFSIALEYRFLTSDLEREFTCSGIETFFEHGFLLLQRNRDLGGIDIKFWLRYDLAALSKEWMH